MEPSKNRIAVKIILAILIILFFGVIFLCYGQIRQIKAKYFSSIDNTDGKTNFLLLGMNGASGIDKDLTDTMIFLSLNKISGKVVFVSIPRDVWIDSLKAKINTAYHYGGIPLAEKTVGDILGQKVDYTMVINFDGFEKAIDILGGVRVNVQNSFDDYLYPIAGKETDLCNGDKKLSCRYEHLHFDAGTQWMNGATALKYVRSRHAVGTEGTDFARTARQQQLLQGFKAQLLTKEVFLSPEKLSGLFQVYREYVLTNIRENQYGNLAILASKIDWNNVQMASLTTDNFLINPKIHSSKQWVLIPKVKDWSEVQTYIGQLLE